MRRTVIRRAAVLTAAAAGGIGLVLAAPLATAQADGGYHHDHGKECSASKGDVAGLESEDGAGVAIGGPRPLVVAAGDDVQGIGSKWKGFHCEQWHSQGRDDKKDDRDDKDAQKRHGGERDERGGYGR